ncbi:hypothetical protein [Couchioplanes caeruleus]|uniref:ABC bacteriocin transporter/peptidase n=2 Tax=Couchioplanes caeruleus TaxID=56438 RepID=A0A1K0H2K8_9ACTN|nr:hypothetical protein [Couchioplanes caeruleus]OJF15939.1 ABC bacteriocin transporter/peptidase [Couchioplanes caeruleus subsp. caeruleus]
MPRTAAVLPTQLSVFCLNPATGIPAGRGLPVYAEVQFHAAAPGEPLAGFNFDDFVAAFRDADPQERDDAAVARDCWDAFRPAVAATLSATAAADLAADRAAGRAFAAEVIRHAVNEAGRLGAVPPARLPGLFEAAVRAVARERGLDLRTPGEAPRGWAYPLGVLASDHCGYLSFDLTRLPTPVRAAIGEAMQVRRQSPDGPRDVAVWLAAAGSPDRVDALVDGRFAEAVIVARLAAPAPPLLDRLRGRGLPAIQRPSLADWRLSPGSFSATLPAVFGDHGCETMLPASLAIQAFQLQQAVLLTDVSAPADPVRLGVVHEYAVRWFQLGHSLGGIVHSVPLAPGESVNLAVIDWSRADDAARDEDTKVTEQLLHDQRRDRTITETVDAALSEYQGGSSSMSGLAGSAGASGSIGVAGAAVGLSGAIGGASSASRGRRDLSSQTVQRVSDHITQASSAVRELRSTVVVHSTQAEREVIETRTVVNYNHAHALTVLYYEVLRHFRVATALERERPAVFVRTRVDWFDGADDAATAVAARFAGTIRAALLDPTLSGHVDALIRTVHRRQVHTAVPAPPARPEPPLVYFRFAIRTGGVSATGGSNQRVEIRGTFIGPGGATGLVNRALGDIDTLGYPGAFEATDHTYVFVAGVSPAPPRNGSVPWGDVDAILLGVAPENCDVGIQRITLTARDADGREHPLLDMDYRGSGGDLFVTQPTSILLPLNRPAGTGAPAVPPAGELDDLARTGELLAHLRANPLHYGRALLVALGPAERERWLAGIRLPDNSSVLEHVENRLVEFAGPWVCFPCVDPAWADQIRTSAGETPPEPPVENLITLPARGAFAEARLGHCSAAEEIDNSRFWDWQSSPIPHLAPEIAPVQPVQPQPQNPDLTPSPLPSPVVNIVNPAPAPDPTGMAAALAAIATPNIFRDMSGRGELADLLKRLSDNTIGIAEAASVARRIQTPGGSGGPGGFGGGAGGYSGGYGGMGAGGIGGQRSGPQQPSAVNRDLQDLRRTLGQAQQSGYLTPEQAQAAYGQAVQNALTPDDLHQVDSRYTPPATTKNSLLGLIGEQNLADALTAKGLTVFHDWSKNVNANGVDLIAYDPTTKTLWLVDNKAQMKGISGAGALTGPQYTQNLADARRFLADVYPDRAAAIPAVEAIDAGRINRVVGNAWAGAETRFTQAIFDSGLHVFDVRLMRLFAPGERAAWLEAFTKLPRGAIKRAVRGTAVLDGVLLVLAVAEGASYLARGDLRGALQVAGEVATEITFGTLLSKLPGGLFAGFALEIKPDNWRELEREERIGYLTKKIPDYHSRPQAERDQIHDALGAMLEHPLEVQLPPPVAPPPRQIAPFLWYPYKPDWT